MMHPLKPVVPHAVRLGRAFTSWRMPMFFPSDLVVQLTRINSRCVVRAVRHGGPHAIFHGFYSNGGVHYWVSHNAPWDISCGTAWGSIHPMKCASLGTSWGSFKALVSDGAPQGVPLGGPWDPLWDTWGDPWGNP